MRPKVKLWNICICCGNKLAFRDSYIDFFVSDCLSHRAVKENSDGHFSLISKTADQTVNKGPEKISWKLFNKENNL